MLQADLYSELLPWSTEIFGCDILMSATLRAELCAYLMAQIAAGFFCSAQYCEAILFILCLQCLEVLVYKA